MKEKVLITVKTYPTLSSTYGELVCTAGVKEDGSWVRLYPVPFRRFKDINQKYQKYSWVEVDLEKNTNDKRPESYRPVDWRSIQVLDKINTGKKRDWVARKEIILKKCKVYHSMDELIEKAHNNKLSLALFKPAKIKDFVYEPVEREWDMTRLAKVKEKYYGDFALTKDLYLYLGTLKQWHQIAPNPFVIIEFHPPITNQQEFEF